MITSSRRSTLQDFSPREWTRLGTSRILPPAMLLAGAVVLAGCATTPSSIRENEAALPAAQRVSVVEQLAERGSLTWDVTKRPLAHRPWLAASREDRLRLDQLDPDTTDTTAFQDAASALLDSMLARGGDDLRLGELGLGKHADPSADLEVLADAEHARLAALSTPDERRRWLGELRGELPPKHVNGGRALRMLATFPAVPFMYAWIARHATTEDKGPYAHEFENASVFEPSHDADAATAAHLEKATPEELLAYFAPRIVQQIPSDAKYDPADDKLGSAGVRLDQRGRVESFVDPASPTVYSYITHASLAGKWHNQLNYEFWYPEHPAQGSMDPEAGPTEGVMVRLTLDLNNHPLVAETAFACGCFHRLFPVDALDHEATETYGAVESGRSALAKSKTLAVDPIIPQTMGIFDPASPHPSVYVDGGKHFAGAVEFSGPIPRKVTHTPYRLADAGELERLPLGDGYASFFRRDGLVRGADRPEATMLFAAGFYHPGTPRIRGSHLIHFDEYDYDDPKLLEELLRLPPSDYLEDISLSPYAGGPATGSVKTVQRAKKKTFFCPC